MSTPLPPLRIVIVEDSPDLLEGWKDILELDGHTVTGFLHARDTLADRAAVERADVLVSDYYLPDLNGVELIRRCRAMRSDLPAILLTGAKDRSIREQLDAVADVMLLYKPLRSTDLEQAIKRLLSSRSAGSVPARISDIPAA